MGTPNKLVATLVISCVFLNLFGVVRADVTINEFLAKNQEGIEDEDGDSEDWIELHNDGATAVDLEDWSLTDNSGSIQEWTFPEVTIEAGTFLVIFASDKNRKTRGNLHTNFKLSGGGEFLALYDDSQTAVTVFSPQFPAQQDDVSYAYDPVEERWRYCDTPSPGEANADGLFFDAYTSAVPGFSHTRGFYDTAFSLTLSGTSIHYTLDGSMPTLASPAYSSAISIANHGSEDRGTVVRAAVISESSGLTTRGPTVTHTYLVDMSDALQGLPAISIAADGDSSLWDPSGIMTVSGGSYVNGRWKMDDTDDYNLPIMHGREHEAPISIEYIHHEDDAKHDRNDGFRRNAGLRVAGSDAHRLRYRMDTTVQRTQPWPESVGGANMRKFSFRSYFRIGGDLSFAAIPGTTRSGYDQLVLRAGWIPLSPQPPSPAIVDELVRRLHSDMGHLAPQGTFVHLFINGYYKSYYNLCERVNDDFLRTYFPEWSQYSWDIVKQPESGRAGGFHVDDGDGNAFWDLLEAVRNEALDQDAYDFAEDYMDMVNFIDYLLVQLYCGNQDWPVNNWFAARPHTTGGKFQFYVWDAELSFMQAHINKTAFTSFPIWHAGGLGLNGEDGPLPYLYQRLKGISNFKDLFAERIEEHLFTTGGALTDANVDARFFELKAEMAAVLPNMDEDIVDLWIPDRRDVLLDALEDEGFDLPD